MQNSMNHIDQIRIKITLRLIFQTDVKILLEETKIIEKIDLILHQ